MRIINLDQNFKPYGGLGELFIKTFTFPSGVEPHVNVAGLDIKGNYDKQEVIITHRIKNMNDLMTIILTNDALQKKYHHEIDGISLFIPYLPFSRQDRTCSVGDPFSLEIIANILNSCNFKTITVLDIHSDASFKYIRNLESLSFKKSIQFDRSSFDNYIIVSPDNGSRKRCNNFLHVHSKNETVEFSKVRDPNTGNLSGFECEKQDFEGKDCLIVDDICSRGGTFMGIAKILKERNAGKVLLAVSHYEGIADEKKMKESGINMVYKTNSMNDYESDFVKNINIKLI